MVKMVMLMIQWCLLVRTLFFLSCASPHCEAHFVTHCGLCVWSVPASSSHFQQLQCSSGNEVADRLLLKAAAAAAFAVIKTVLSADRLCRLFVFVCLLFVCPPVWLRNLREEWKLSRQSWKLARPTDWLLDCIALMRCFTCHFWRCLLLSVLLSLLLTCVHINWLSNDFRCLFVHSFVHSSFVCPAVSGTGRAQASKRALLRLPCLANRVREIERSRRCCWWWLCWWWLWWWWWWWWWQWAIKWQPHLGGDNLLPLCLLRKRGK